MKTQIVKKQQNMENRIHYCRGKQRLLAGKNFKTRGITALLTIIVCIVLSASAQTTNNFIRPEHMRFSDERFRNDYIQFLENWKSPLMSANTESFNLNGTVWQRYYGEKEYYLPPIINDIRENNKRIRRLDDPENEVYKSKYCWVNVEVTPVSKSHLTGMGIIVPDYVLNTAIVYLPEIDIDELSSVGINMVLLPNYGIHKLEFQNNNSNQGARMGGAVSIWSENWESSSLPGSGYSTGNTGSNNCTWDDVNCFDCGGSWSIWCAGYGSSCNALCTSYLNDMDAYVYKPNLITGLGCYTNLQFAYDVKINTASGSIDKLQYYYNTGSGWILNVEYPNNISSCTRQYHNLSGSWSGFTWEFNFHSNWINTDGGAYLDDLELTGTLNTTLSVNVTTSPSTCGQSNGSVSASRSGGTSPFTYNWSGTSCSSSNCQNLPAGNFCVTVTDGCGATASDCGTITNNGNPPNANASTTQHTTCNQCNGTVTASGGSSYTWSDGLGQGPTRTAVCWGTYFVTVTNSSGCTAEAQTTVNSSFVPNVTASTTKHTTCGLNNGIITANASGGASPYIYNWSGLGSGQTKSNVAADFYTVTVTDDDGCTATDNTTVNPSPDISVSTSSTDANCGNNDGSVTATPSGGTPPYTYLWLFTGGCTTATCNNLGADTYNVTVTDASGCTATGYATVNDIGSPTSTISNSTNDTGGCNGSATVSASGGTQPYSYIWSNNQTSSTATGLCKHTTYYVTVTDANQCKSIADVDIVNSIEIFTFLTHLTLYPNPTTGTFILSMELTQSEPLHLYILNSIGQVVHDEELRHPAGSYQSTIDLSRHAKGVYLMQIAGKEGVMGRKVVVY